MALPQTHVDKFIRECVETAETKGDVEIQASFGKALAKRGETFFQVLLNEASRIRIQSLCPEDKKKSKKLLDRHVLKALRTLGFDDLEATCRSSLATEVAQARSVESSKRKRKREREKDLEDAEDEQERLLADAKRLMRASMAAKADVGAGNAR